MNAEYLSEHLANRIFGFGMRVATWLEPSFSSQTSLTAPSQNQSRKKPCKTTPDYHHQAVAKPSNFSLAEAIT
jgi:hypothetical protein